MSGHWKAYFATDNCPPAETRCFADPDDAVLYLANELAGREADDTEDGAGGDYYWGLVEEYRAGFEEMGERFADLMRGDKDPAEWVGCGPAVLVVGVDYVIEGCDGADCRVQPAREE